MRMGNGKGSVPRPMILALLFTLVVTVQAENMDRYRGVDNSGAYAAKGLLRVWPKDGPKLLWKTDVGAGWANVAVVDGKVYIPGGLTAQLFVYDLDGNLLDKAVAGSAIWKKWSGSRTTPIVHNGMAAIGMPNADYVGIDLKTMEARWQLNAWKGFGSGKGSMGWGWPESPMRHENKLIFNPCSRDAETPGIVAVDIRNGKTVWELPGKGDIRDSKGLEIKKLRYSAMDVSGACFRHNGRDLVAYPTISWFVCLDAQTGKLLWELPTSGGNLPPVYSNGRLLADLGGSLRMLELAPDGTSVKTLWTRAGGVGFGGGTMFGDRLYLIANKNALPVAGDGAAVPPALTNRAPVRSVKPETALVCLDAQTGNLIASLPSSGQGNVVSAEGMVYVADAAAFGAPLRVRLVRPTAGGMEVAGELSVKDPTGGEQGWHVAISPVVAEGRLFIHYGNLYVYDLRVEKPAIGWRHSGNGIVEGAHPPLPWSRAANLRWSVAVDGSAETLTAAEGRVLVGSPGALSCVDGTTGKTLWTHQQAGVQSPWTACATVREGAVFAVFGNGAVTRLNLADGKMIWTALCKTSPGHKITAPLLSENVLAVQGAELTGFDVETGSVLWKHPVPDNAYGTPAKLRLDGVGSFVTGWGALVRTTDGVITVKDLPTATGDLLAGDYTAYLCGATVTALRFVAKDGVPAVSKQWESKVSASGLAPLEYNGLLFVPAKQPALLALDAATGKTVGELSLADPLVEAPFLVNGHLWLPGRTTRVVMPTAGMEMVWEFSGSVKALAFSGDGVTVLSGNRLHHLAGGTVTEPVRPVSISVDPVANAVLPSGFPVSPFVDNTMPIHWLWAAPIPGRNLTNDFLAPLGGIAKALPAPGTAFTAGGKNYHFQSLTTNHLWQDKRFTANLPAIDLTAIHNRQFHTTGLYMTAIKNDKDRWVKVALLTPGRSHFRSQLDFAVFLSGKRVEENVPIRLPAGRHVLFIQAAIGDCATWGKIWMCPRLIDVTDTTEKALANDRATQEAWRTYQETEANKPFVLP